MPETSRSWSAAVTVSNWCGLTTAVTSFMKHLSWMIGPAQHLARSRHALEEPTGAGPAPTSGEGRAPAASRGQSSSCCAHRVEDLCSALNLERRCYDTTWRMRTVSRVFVTGL